MPVYKTKKRLTPGFVWAGLLLGTAGSARGAFDVSMWNLSTRLTQQTANGPVSDRVDILDLSNPLSQTVRAEIGDSFSESEFDYSWLIADATGQFLTTVEHQIRAPEFDNICTSSIFIVATEPIRVTVSGSLSYSHTPGDVDFVDFFASVRDTSTSVDLFHQHEEGGNLYFLPSAGQLYLSGEAILDPGVTYRLRYGLSTGNSTDLLPTGTLDAQGWVRFQVTPVPSPSTLAMLLPVFGSLIFRRPGRA